MEYLSLIESGDVDKAEQSLLAAAALKDPLALHTLGYEAQVESPPNIKHALALYRMAAREGYEPSMINLARYYEMALNARQYIYWIRRSAEIGSDESKKELSNPFPYLIKFANELRSAGKIPEARKIYKFCANNHSVDGMINFANIIDLYDRRKNRKLSEFLYVSAIESGSGLAAFNLANHYADYGETENYMKYLRISADLGYALAKKRLRELSRE